MNRFFVFLEKEKVAFRILSPHARQLLISFFLFELASPLIGVFTNTFLWRQTHEPTALIVYNLLFFVGLPLGFYINGHLLKKFQPAVLYWLGCIVEGVVPFLLIITNSSWLPVVGLLGLIFGVAGGFFWANRNFLTLKVTTEKDRLYFGSLESSLGTVAAVIVPMVIGWFLVLGEHVGWYSTENAYRVMAVLGVLALIAVGSLPKNVHLRSSAPTRVTLGKPTAIWKKLRWLEGIHGLQHGLEIVLPTLLVLTLVGSEESIGTIQSVSALLSAIAMYAIGTRLQRKHRTVVLAMWVVSAIVSALLVSTFFSVFGVICYFAIMSLTADFRWVTLMPITFDLIDQEVMKSDSHQYPMLFDREIFLNLGRVSAVLAFLVASAFFPVAALRYGLLFAAVFQIAVYFLAKQISFTETTEVQRP